MNALQVERIGPRRYAVVDLAGSGQPHAVDLSTERTSCECADHQYRRRACKHIGAAEHYRRPVGPELRAIGKEIATIKSGLGTMAQLEARARVAVLGE